MPRKPNPTCPIKLQEQIDVINAAPKTVEDWTELSALLKKIMAELEALAADPIFSDNFDYGVEMEDHLLEKYRSEVKTRVAPDKFQAFALSLENEAEADIFGFRQDVSSGRKEIDAALLRIRRARIALHEIIWAAKFDNGDGWITTNSQRFFVLEKWMLTESDYSDPLSIILANKIPIDRLNICSICDKVYWQNYRGKVRVSETCGVYECGYKLANLKRKSPPEVRFRFVKKEEKSDGSL